MVFKLKMMRSGRSLLLTGLMAALFLHLCSKSEAASNFDCCLQYTTSVIPVNSIVAFTQQLANEACDIDAVIFHTKKNLAVCADPKQLWVKRTVRILSRRAKTI